MTIDTSAKAARVTEPKHGYFSRGAKKMLNDVNGEWVRRADFEAASIAPDAEPVAYEYACRLLMAIVRKFPDAHPEFAPLPDLYGVLTQIDNATTGLVAKDAVGEADTQLNGRDLWECANQLLGYSDETTPERLFQFLTREGNAASDLADEVLRLRKAASIAPDAEPVAPHIERFDGFDPEETIGAFDGSGQWIELMTVRELRAAPLPAKDAVGEAAPEQIEAASAELEIDWDGDEPFIRQDSIERALTAALAASSPPKDAQPDEVRSHGGTWSDGGKCFVEDAQAVAKEGDRD